MVWDSGVSSCPVCQADLEQHETESGVLKCSVCCTQFPRGSVLSAGSYAVDIQNPPPGARLERLPDGFRITASLRWGILFLILLLPWAPLGTAIVVMIVWAVLPDGFAEASSGRFRFWLTLVLALSATAAAAFRGRLRITLEGDRLTIFAGVLGVGWKSTHHWSSFRTVYEEQLSRSRSPFLTLKGEREVSFGSLLSERRLRFVLQALRAMLAERSEGGAVER